MYYKYLKQEFSVSLFLDASTITTNNNIPSTRVHPKQPPPKNEPQPKKPGIFEFFSGSMKKSPKYDHSIPSTSLLKQRKAPIKVEPKVFFANERTFLAWMHISIILAGSSIAIIALTDEHANVGGQLYGIVTLPVALAFIIYSMYQCECYSIRIKYLFLTKKAQYTWFSTSTCRCEKGLHDSE